MAADELYFAWRRNPLARNAAEFFLPVIYRENHGPTGEIYLKYPLKPHEHWLGLEELMARYPLKG